MSKYGKIIPRKFPNIIGGLMMDDEQRLQFIMEDKSIKKIMDNLLNCPYGKAIILKAFLKALELEHQRNQQE